MRVLLIGARGQLGRDIERVLKSEHQLTGMDAEDCDITNHAQLTECVANARPDTVINTAAWTDVPGCDKNDKKAFEINAIGVKYVAHACHQLNARLIHISTDYVFDGVRKKPYTETDVPRPLNAYGISKLAAEFYIQSIHPRHLILRTSGLYGIHECLGKKTNFVETMLRLGQEGGLVRVVDDEILTPTYAYNFAQQIRQLVACDEYGIFHATNHGSCSWYEFASRIFRIAGMNVNLERVSIKDYPSPVRRPSYSVLENARLKSLGLDVMTDWQTALEHYFEDRKNITN